MTVTVDYMKRALLGALGTLVTAVTLASPAGADPADALFITRLTQAGFGMQDVQRTINEAKIGCLNALSTHNPHDIANYLWKVEPSLSFNEVGTVAKIAAQTYCPAVLYFSDPEATPSATGGTWT